MPPYALADQVCIAGWGKGDFLGLCNFSCALGYCPVGACVCTKMGPHPDKPAVKGVQDYPAAGRDANFAGLCSFSCNYGYCPSGVCDTVQHPLTIPTKSPFVPDTCVSGTGQDSFAGLCSYSCNFGFCPIHRCTCTGVGPLIESPPKNTSITGYSPSVDDSDLCMFACQRGYCPSPICQEYSADEFVCGASEDDYDVDCGETMPCDFTKSYDTLADLANVMDTIDPYCTSYYSINVLGRMLDDAMVDYNSVGAGDYDKKFNDYVDYIKDTIPLQLRQFLLDPNSTVSRGNKYFECAFDGPGPREACPIDTNFDTGRVTVTYYLVDADGFYADLAVTYGIQKEWVKFGEYDTTQCRGPVLGDVQCTIYYGFPLKSSNVTVDNPKDIVTKALPGIRSLNTTIALTQLEINAGTWTGVLDDVIQTISTAVFLVQQAIDSMKSVVKIADDYEDEKEKRLVETILGVVLLVLPFVGELDYFTESMVVLGRMLRLATDVGLVGTTIYSVVEDPSLAPFTILTALMGGARTPETFSTTAAARRKMTDEDIEALGPVFKNNNMNYQSVAGQCRKELST
ncbi:hypothetical protein IFM53868_05776 [Aspergillus udagawae]|uniref:Uncharacterized protein n=1 Tax=Aspergillus udagawae TaxID=91492 RepID=A0ABQ1AWB9_9EURO|nr:hypothetical protein IFM53868_05776 [Aspergillus udagawae]GFG15339.1 hypothetical protein IFM5058_07403 [Aspergillus udagawae]